MSDLKLNKDGDLEIVNGGISLLSGKDEWIAQKLRIRLRTYKGEWYLDRTVGVPYFETILKKATPKALIDSIYKTVILDTVGVKGITSFSSEVKDTEYKLQFSYLTVNGTIKSISESLPL